MHYFIVAFCTAVLLSLILDVFLTGNERSDR